MTGKGCRRRSRFGTPPDRGAGERGTGRYDDGPDDASSVHHRAAGSHAALTRLVARVGEAGIAALDGQTGAARAGLLAAYAELRDVGAARKQAITGLVLATLLGPGDAQVRAAITESRQLFERMGAGLWLGLLDAAATGKAPAPKARSVPADRG